MLSIKDGVALYHQTLTFAPQETDRAKAKKKLNTLLNNLHKQFPEMASVYIQELHASLKVHYQVYFLFFDPSHLPYPESEMLKEFGDRVFDAWKRLQTGKLFRGANEMHVYQKGERSLEYGLKDVRLEDEGHKSTSKTVHWWGFRPRKVFAKYTTKPKREDVLRAYHWRYELRPLKLKAMTSTERSRDWRFQQKLDEMFGPTPDYPAECFKTYPPTPFRFPESKE